jgi:uncharacterized protein YdeI (YjbR/CyaY-like superfamily)
MGKTDARVDAYIGISAAFAQPILKHLRRLVHSACPEVEETIKWGMPHFTHLGNLCHMAAFKRHCAFGFWRHKLIVGEGSNAEAMGQFGRISAPAEMPPDKLLADYIRKAARLNEAGVKTPGRSAVKKKLVVPAYFQAALKKNKKALAMFEGFSPSHRREYVDWITEAKREETRQARIKTALEWLAKGKPRNWKYMNC